MIARFPGSGSASATWRHPPGDLEGDPGAPLPLPATRTRPLGRARQQRRRIRPLRWSREAPRERRSPGREQCIKSSDAYAPEGELYVDKDKTAGSPNR